MSVFDHDDAIRSMVRRSRLLKVDDSGAQQLVDLMNLAGDKPRKVFRPQPFGITSHPPVNSEGLVLAAGGRSDRLLYLDGGHWDHRPKSLGEGCSALYDAYGKIIKLVKDRVEVDAGGKDVVIRNASKVTVEATTDVAVGIAGKRYVRIREHRVDLAVKEPGDEAPYKVSTEAGLSGVVFARLD